MYRNSLRKLKLLESFKNMFFMFDAYITIEHCEIRECIHRYTANRDSVSPILEDAARLMDENKMIGFDRAIKRSLDSFTEKNSQMLEKSDIDIIVHTCREIDGLKRGFISEILAKTGQFLEKRVQECREKDVKNGKMFNQIGILIGIAIVILII